MLLQPNVWVANSDSVDQEPAGQEGGPAGYVDLIAADENTVTIAPEGEIGVGAIISAGIDNATPYGLLRRVVSVDRSNNNLILTTVPAALDEAIKECDEHFSYFVTQDGDLIPATSELGWSGADLFATRAYAEDSVDNLLDLTNETKEVSLSAGLRLDVDLKISNGVTNFRTVLHTQGLLSVKPVNFEADVTLFEKQVPGTALVGPIPVVWNNVINIDLDATSTVDGSLEPLKINIDRQYGFEYKSGKGLTEVNEDNSETKIFELDKERVAIQADGGLGISYAFLLYDVAGPKIDASVECEIAAGFQKPKPSTKSLLFNIGSTTYQGHVKAKITLPITGQFVLEIPGFNPFTKSDSIELLKATLFDTDDLITLFELEEPKVSPDFIKEAVDLNDLRLPYDIRANSPTFGIDKSSCEWAGQSITDVSPLAFPMPNDANECWQSVKYGESEGTYTTEYTSGKYIKLRPEDPKYADFNGDGYTDVLISSTVTWPYVSDMFYVDILFANPEAPENPYVLPVFMYTQDTCREYEFYEGGVFTKFSGSCSLPGERDEEFFQFIQTEESIAIESTPSRGENLIMRVDR